MQILLFSEDLYKIILYTFSIQAFSLGKAWDKLSVLCFENKILLFGVYLCSQWTQIWTQISENRDEGSLSAGAGLLFPEDMWNLILSSQRLMKSFPLMFLLCFYIGYNTILTAAEPGLFQ